MPKRKEEQIYKIERRVPIKPSLNEATIEDIVRKLLGTLRIYVATTNYTIVSSVDMVVCNALPITIYLESTPAAGRSVVIKDGVGGAGSGNPITVDGNGKNIDGQSIVILKADDASIGCVYSADLDEWFIK